MVVSSIRALTQSFAGSMEARFGELIAKGWRSELQAAYRKYQLLLSTVTVTLFGCTGALILPFVRLYTQGVTDADYLQPAFAAVLLLAEAINCLVLPCASLPIAANHLRQTRWGAYGEAILNIAISLVLIRWQPLLGVAIGTFAATLFRGIYYMAYSARKILALPARRVLAGFAAALLLLIAVAAGGNAVMERIQIQNFLQWVLCGAAMFGILAVPAALTVRFARRRSA